LVNFEPSAIRPIPLRVEEAPDPTPVAAPSPNDLTDTSGLTPDELDELLIFVIRVVEVAPRPFLTTWPVCLCLRWDCCLVAALVAASGIAVIWRRRVHRTRDVPAALRANWSGSAAWSGTLRPRRSDTPLEVAERLGRQVPRAQPAIDALTEAYVEGTYSSRLPGRDSLAHLASRATRCDSRECSAGASAAGSAKEHRWHCHPALIPELLSRWGARRKPPKA